MSNTAFAFPGWTWDPARNDYFYYNPQERCYIYQGGQRIAYNRVQDNTGSSSRFALKSSTYCPFLISNAGKLVSHYLMFLGQQYQLRTAEVSYKMQEWMMTPTTIQLPKR
jgi:hypothetical protein